MQHADDQQRDWQAQVERALRTVNDLAGLAQITQHELGSMIGGQQRPRMRGHHLVVVDVDNPRVRIDRLRDLVNVLPGRQACAQIEELVHPRLGDGPHHPLHERAIGASILPNAGLLSEKFFGQLPVSRVIILAAKQIVVYPGNIGPSRIDCRGNVISHAQKIAHDRNTTRGPPTRAPANLTGRPHPKRLADLPLVPERISDPPNQPPVLPRHRRPRDRPRANSPLKDRRRVRPGRPTVPAGSLP